MSYIQFQIDDIDKQIETIRENRFNIGGILSDVGSIAGVVVGMATGVGAIVSVAGGLATLKSVTDGIDLVQFLKFLKEKPDPNSRTSEDIQDVKALGGGMKDLIQAHLCARLRAVIKQSKPQSKPSRDREEAVA